MTAAVVALAAAGCGTSKDSGGSTSSDSSGKYTGKGIGLAYDIGGKGDQSFNDAAYAGFQKAETEFKIGGRDIEPQDGESNADKVQRLEQLAKAGYNPVIGVGFVYAPAVKEVAAKYPKVTFGIIDDEQDKASNVADMVFHEEQASYLAGVAAAKTTKKDHIGFIGGVNIPLIHKFEAGFVQGAKSVNPKIQIEKQYLTETAQEGGFSSPDKGKDAAAGQIEAGADVLYHAAGLSGQGVISEAAGKKVWAIGVDSDQYSQSALAKYKDYILGSALKNVGGAVYDLVKSVYEGKPKTGVVRGGLANDGVGFADTNPKYKAMTDVVAAVDKAKQDIIDGKITVNTK
ncbi:MULTISPECIES: BMP family ABC transporter substrate-binding protein [Streptomyces]|uniref:BMP family protein n=1 Tax=Streptomyces lutosisoli TaxID=2665721 RepID=A0ABW2VB80_9ACTN|nr:BMP family ABC transporter substrate-binding protein [Streptomyces sp. NBC_00589]WTI36731.1 BMP family ABC transporter substrate-binding protein [Streptomyces sp. NBC_00775]WUB29592.1 BMP family ABC transporter substrate-binding protein [Streptomyces sp. NBC_00589]